MRDTRLKSLRHALSGLVLVTFVKLRSSQYHDQEAHRPLGKDIHNQCMHEIEDAKNMAEIVVVSVKMIGMQLHDLGNAFKDLEEKQEAALLRFAKLSHMSVF